MKKLVGILTVGLLTLTSLAGCVNAEEITGKVVQALYNVSTYQFNMDITMDITSEANGESLDIAMTMDSFGELDIVDKRMRMEMVTIVALPEEEEMRMGFETYIIGNNEYTYSEMAGVEYGWVKSRMPIGTWDEINDVESQVELLETAGVELVGSEEVMGTDCYVLRLTPDLTKLWQTFMEQSELAGTEMPDITKSMTQEVFRNVSVKQWIDKKTYFLVKAEVEMGMEITPEIMGYSEEEGIMTMDVAMNLLAYNYNQPVSIVLPPEAEEATEETTMEEWEEEAAETEFVNIQTAVYALMIDNELSTLSNPVTVATDDMGAFPDTSVCGIDKLFDSYGNPYIRGQDKNGYLLYQHDITGDGASVMLVNYVAADTTKYWYSVDCTGTVTQFTESTQVPTSLPILPTAPDVIKVGAGDIEFIIDEAERMSVQVQSLTHEGESITITCEASDYTIFRDYVTALRESGRFSTITPPPENYSYITGGTIELEPNFQYVNMLAVCYEANSALAPIEDSEAIAIIVGIAEKNGIDIDPENSDLRIPAAAIHWEEIAGNRYQVLSFRNIQLQGDYEDVMAFISDLDSQETLKTMILTGVVIKQIEAYDEAETVATVDVDIYTKS